MKNILITGGAGFIGSHLCDALVEENHVICVDNFVGGSQENIAHLLSHPNFFFIKHDITALLELDRIAELKKFKLKGLGIDEVYHLALPTSPKQFLNLRREILLTNSLGTLQMLDLAVRYKAKFLLASSSVVYGSRAAAGAVDETVFGSVDALSQRGCYDEGKRFAETAAQTYHDLTGLDVKIARLGRVYGPRMSIADGHMIPDFILAAISGKPLVVYGDESFQTALLYISDCVEALKRFMDAPKEPGVLNIGSDEDHAIVKVANAIITMVGSKSQVKFEKPLLFMTPLALLDIHKAKEFLEWFPITRLEDGLAKTVEYARATKGVVHRY